MSSLTPKSLATLTNSLPPPLLLPSLSLSLTVRNQCIALSLRRRILPDGHHHRRVIISDGGARRFLEDSAGGGSDRAQARGARGRFRPTRFYAGLRVQVAVVRGYAEGRADHGELIRT